MLFDAEVAPTVRREEHTGATSTRSIKMVRVRSGAGGAVSVSPARARLQYDELGTTTATNNTTSNGREEDPNQWQSELYVLFVLSHRRCA